MNRKRRKSFYKDNKEIIWGAVGAFLVIFLGLVLPPIFSPELSLLENLGVMQVSFSALAFFAVFIALILTMRLFRKSMAKPKLEVIFSETGNSETSIDIPEEKEVKHELKLSVVNRGNAITKLFQIDFKLPTIFAPRLEATTGLIPRLAFAGTSTNPQVNADMTSTISYYSNEQVYCFVNAPAPIHMLVINTRPKEYNNYPPEFKIKYKVYGDWAETQEAKLKVICKKNQEVS